MKKVLSLLLIVFMAFSLSGCGDALKLTTAGLLYEGLEELEKAESELPGLPEDFVLDLGEVEEQVLVDNENIKITFNNFSQTDFSGYLTINLTVENKLDKAITLSSMSAAVNGYMLGSSCYTTVGIKQTEGVSCRISLSDIYNSGITSVGEVKLSFDDSVSDIECPLLTIRTSLYGTIVDNTTVEGDIFYEGNGVKIINRGFGDIIYTSLGSALGGASNSPYGLNLYIENSLEEEVILDVGYCTLNGVVCDVNEIITFSGCKNYVPITFGITYDQNDRESVIQAAVLQEKENIEEICLVYDIVGAESGTLYSGEYTLNVK